MAVRWNAELGRKAAAAMAEGLCLAATPAFAVMAVLAWTSVGHHSAICGAAPNAWAPTGMAAMYALMCAVHAPPWLRRLSRPPRPAYGNLTLVSNLEGRAS
jgi:hypothetical protein